MTFADQNKVRTPFLGWRWSVLILVGYLLIVASGQLYEGSSCQSVDGTYGFCRAFRLCKWAYDGFRTQTLTYKDLFRCGFQGRDELICCLDEKNDQSTTEQPFVFFDNKVDGTTMAPNPVIEPVETTTTSNRLQGPRISDTECTRFAKEYSPLTFHILGGEEADPGEFPHMVALGYPSEEEGETYKFDCGGALISERFVLTAAHCLSKAQPVIVRMGTVALLTQDQQAAGQDVNIAELISHPDYMPSRNYHDIALLRLESEPNMSENIHPGCLRQSMDEPTGELIVTGWGVTSLERRDKSGTLLRTNLTAVPLDTCNQTYSTQPGLSRRLPNLLNRGQLCAFDPNRVNDACQGDSGGPLQIKQSNNFAIIVGVTSFGISCASHVPGVYARVAFYLDWIESIVWPNS